jgi:hypothetical protein
MEQTQQRGLDMSYVLYKPHLSCVSYVFTVGFMDHWLQQTLGSADTTSLWTHNTINTDTKRKIAQELADEWHLRGDYKPETISMYTNHLQLPQDAREFREQQEKAWVQTSTETQELCYAASQDLNCARPPMSIESKESPQSFTSSIPRRYLLVCCGYTAAAPHFHAGMITALQQIYPQVIWELWAETPLHTIYEAVTYNHTTGRHMWSELLQSLIDQDTVNVQLCVSYAGPQRLPPITLDSLPCVDPSEIQNYWEFCSALWRASLQKQLSDLWQIRVSVTSCFHGATSDSNHDSFAYVKRRLGTLFTTRPSVVLSSSLRKRVEQWARVLTFCTQKHNYVDLPLPVNTVTASEISELPDGT